MRGDVCDFFINSYDKIIQLDIFDMSWQGLHKSFKNIGWRQYKIYGIWFKIQNFEIIMNFYVFQIFILAFSSGIINIEMNK